MLPKDVLKRFVNGPFQYGELRNRVSAQVGEKLAGQDANSGAQPMDIRQIDNPKERTKMSMLNCVVRAINPIRNISKSPTTSEIFLFVGLPTHHHQRHVNRLQETRNPGVMRQNRVRGRRSVPPATSVVEKAILPGSAHQRMNCPDVDEVGIGAVQRC